MEQRGLTRRDLEPYIGSRARVAEVFNHKRPPTLAMIQRLHAGLGIPADVLMAALEGSLATRLGRIMVAGTLSSAIRSSRCRARRSGH